MARQAKNRKRVSLLSLRIFVIVIFPTAMFFIGLLHIDQYRQTVIQSEIDALYRQGNTLARAIAFTDSRYTEEARRRLSELTMQRVSQIIASLPDARIRVFLPDGELVNDSQRSTRLLRPRITLTPRPGMSDQGLADHGRSFLSWLSSLLSINDQYPLYVENPSEKAGDFPAVITALRGEPASMIMRDRQGRLVLGVAVPIRHLRVVRAALLVTASGEAVENDIEAVQYGFFQIFLGTLLVTILLGLYLARSIIGPISALARAADAVRLSKGNTLSLPKMFDRRDEIGDLARDLADMTDELQRRMQATASFAADVAHEIKNPLTSLRSAVETIARIEDKDQQRKLMDIILADVQRLDRLISDISAASRIDADLSTAEFSVIDLSVMVQNFAEARAHQGDDDRRISLDVGTPPDPVMVSVIVDRLVQVMDNLLANARSFSPDDGIITMRLEAAEGNAVLTMRDQGPGIPDSKTEAIFSRFYSERPKTEAFGQHSGLGLSISRSIIEAHGGSLTAANHPGGGAEMTITLPLAATAQGATVP
ncbi:MAG: sensor histidine kinase [Candidatus Puniceispirillales bacterium]